MMRLAAEIGSELLPFSCSEFRCHFGGVAAPYASPLGKTANCQTLVSLTLISLTLVRLSSGHAGAAIVSPESWTIDRVRRKRAGVLAEHLHGPDETRDGSGGALSRRDWVSFAAYWAMPVTK